MNKLPKPLLKPNQKLHERTATYSRFGRSYCYITCPFCGTQVKAFVWSLAGGGKRCPTCKAMHTSMGWSYQDKT